MFVVVFNWQETEESEPEFVAEDEIEESDLSDLEDWGDDASSEAESVAAEGLEEEEKVLLGKRTRKSRPHVQIEYETEEEPRTKIKAWHFFSSFYHSFIFHLHSVIIYW